MAIVDRRELSAKPEVKKAIARVRRALRSALSGGSFGEREVEVLTISGEAVRELLRDHLCFIGNDKDRMRYVTLRLAGLPVGSGVTESTCKTVFGHRTKRSGQRWRVPTLHGVVTLRALLQSERLPSFWQRLSLCYTANVEAA